MTIDEMRAKKKEFGLTDQMIAEAADVPLSTVQKLLGGVTKSPRKETVDKLTRLFNGYALYAEGRAEYARAAFVKNREKQYGPAGENGMARGGAGQRYTDMVREAGPAYEKQRSRIYTIDDYYALPEDKRVELIDGVFYDMAAPTMLHQKILGDLYLLFRECIDAHGGGCEVYLSPCDVRLDMDNKTMVQPDLMVICREYDVHARAFDGPPDLVVEILSPSTRSRDMLLKLHKYYHAGVREYWIIDSDNQTVLVYDFENENYYPEKYDFDSEIPIHISNGECRIDFSKIKRRIQIAEERLMTSGQ